MLTATKEQQLKAYKQKEKGPDVSFLKILSSYPIMKTSHH